MSIGPEPAPVKEPTLAWYERLVMRLNSQQRAFQQMRDSFLKFRVWVTTILGIAGAVIAMTGWGIISAAWSLQRELGKTEAVITNQSAMMERLEKRFDEMKPLGEKLDRVAESVSRLQGRLERDERPVEKPTGDRPPRPPA